MIPVDSSPSRGGIQHTSELISAWNIYITTKTRVACGNTHRGCTSRGVYTPCIYTNARWELPQRLRSLRYVVRALINSLVLILHERSGPRSVSDFFGFFCGWWECYDLSLLSPFLLRPDVTSMVDWALNTNQLSIYVLNTNHLSVWSLNTNHLSVLVINTDHISTWALKTPIIYLCVNHQSSIFLDEKHWSSICTLITNHPSVWALITNHPSIWTLITNHPSVWEGKELYRREYCPD